MRKNDFNAVSMYCVVCQKPIPSSRKWDAITCSPEHSKLRKDFGRHQKNLKKCKYCLRPSTPEERASYQAWKRWEKKQEKEAKDAEQ